MSCSEFFPPSCGAGSGKQIARGGIQAETGIGTDKSIPPLISLVFQAIGTDAEAGPAALMNLENAGQGAGHSAAVHDPTRHVALTGFRGCFAGFLGSGIAGMTGSGSVPPTFDCAHRNPLVVAEPHGIDVADSPSGCVNLP